MAAKGLQERVYPETELKVEGCDAQEDLKKRVWELERKKGSPRMGKSDWTVHLLELA